MRRNPRRGFPVDIQGNLETFLARRSPEARYASFDYCFNYFQEAREQGRVGRLADEDRMELSCLQLGFYLASWGMLRGSGGLHRRSMQAFAPVVQLIAAEPARSWELDAPYRSEADIIATLDLAARIRKAYPVNASPILVSKTMLGVFGCVPAFDRFFRLGFGGGALDRATLVGITEFYGSHEQELAGAAIPTIDFTTGDDTARRYPVAKVVDMVFFEEGYKRAGRKRE